ncbi:hypothetical protein, partial [Tepidimonas sp.]|uniref:hypothetical protein n=1 Tax=Tepidimonas sp. TaxID=2002775 RepID=UPI00391C4CC4
IRSANATSEIYGSVIDDDIDVDPNRGGPFDFVALSSTIFGGLGNDRISGSDLGSDVIFGGAGDDTIHGPSVRVRHVDHGDIGRVSGERLRDRRAVAPEEHHRPQPAGGATDEVVDVGPLEQPTGDPDAVYVCRERGRRQRGRDTDAIDEARSTVCQKFHQGPLSGDEAATAGQG